MWQAIASPAAVWPLQRIPDVFNTWLFAADLPNLGRCLAVKVALRVAARFLHSFQTICHVRTLPKDNQPFHSGCELLLLSATERRRTRSLSRRCCYRKMSRWSCQALKTILTQRAMHFWQPSAATTELHQKVSIKIASPALFLNLG